MSSNTKKRVHSNTTASLISPDYDEDGDQSPKGHHALEASPNVSLKRKITFIIIIVSILSPFIYIYQQRTARREHAYRLSLKEYNNLLERANVLVEQYRDLSGQRDLPEHLRLKIPTEADLLSIEKERSNGANLREEKREPNPQEDVDKGSVQSQPQEVVTENQKEDQIEEIQQEEAQMEHQETNGDKPDPNRGSKRDIVLGMAQDTDPKNIAVFCGSFRRVSQADMVLFVNKPVPQKTKDLASENNVKLVEFELQDLPPHMQKYHPSTSRWLIFYQYLTRNPKYRILYNRVWLVDVRDTYFQADPFTFIDIKNPSFHIFHGQEAFPISQCGWNSGWIKDCFGPSMLNQVGKNTIICSGVSAGSIDLVLDYLLMMSQVVQGKPLPTSSNYLEDHIIEQFSDEHKALIQHRKAIQHKFPQCERNGVDQGLHNVLVYNNAIPKLMKWDQSSGPVANMQAKVARIRKDNNNNEMKVYNRQNQLSLIVHQYDRDQNLQQYLFEKYVTWMNVNDLKGEWDSDENCKIYGYELDKDLYKGKCDLQMKGGATSAVSCCRFCNQAPSCQAFTYSSGVCFLKSCKTTNSASSHQEIKGLVSGYKLS